MERLQDLSLDLYSFFCIPQRCSPIAIVEKHGLMSHGYADDLQIYSHTDPGSTSTQVSTLSHCVDDLEDWMASNRLRLNPAKTELIWLVLSRRLHRCPSDSLLVSGVWIQPSKRARNLGVIIDSDLSLASHISHVTSLCNYHIRQLRLVQRSLEQDTAETLVRSFIHFDSSTTISYQGICWQLPSGV